MKNKELVRDLEAQTPEQLERVRLIDERCESGSKPEEDLNSYIQLAYYAGHQWIARSPGTNTLVPLPKEPWQVQYTANRIMPAVRTELAKVLKHKLTKGVVPASTEDQDIRAARIADKVVEWLEYDLKLQEIDEEAVMWTLVTRIGFIKCFWNPTKGVTVAQEDGRDIKLGDVDIEVVNLFELKWDSAASRWGDVRWAVQQRQRTVEYIKEVYGKDVPPEDGLHATNIYDGKLRSLSSASSSGMFTAQPTKVKDCAIVKEMWEMPSAKYPKGRRVTVANGVELFYEEDIGFGEEDNSERQLPFFPLIHIPIPGKIIGSAVVEQLIPVQREYNKSRSQIIENKNLMANPKWVAEEGSCEDIDTAPGAIVWYKKGFTPPQMTQPTSLGADVDKNIQHCLEEFMHISGQMEVSNGTTPSGVSSGVAIQLLQEQDDTKLAPTISKYGRFKQGYLSYLLKIIRYKYDVERTVNVVGKNRRVEALQFKGSDLTSTDVRFEEQSVTQLSAAGRKQFIMELIQMGVLNPQMDKDLIFRALELGITDEIYDASEIDVQQAMNENGAWSKQDMSPITREFYNHEVHIAQHNRFRKGEEYEALPEELKAIVDAHVQEHMQYVLQSMAPPTTDDPEDEAGLSMEKVMSSLTPEEQAALQANPAILDSL